MRETWLSENQRLVSQVEHGGALGLSRLVGRNGRERERERDGPEVVPCAGVINGTHSGFR